MEFRYNFDIFVLVFFLTIISITGEAQSLLEPDAENIVWAPPEKIVGVRFGEDIHETFNRLKCDEKNLKTYAIGPVAKCSRIDRADGITAHYDVVNLVANNDNAIHTITLIKSIQGAPNINILSVIRSEYLASFGPATFTKWPNDP